jgi:protein-tyrosine phosphatase
VFNWFKKKSNTPPPLQVDMHSHLLPGLDDGVKTFEEAVTILRHFKGLGYHKIITTPHVMADIYRNTSESILRKCEELRTLIR